MAILANRIEEYRFRQFFCELINIALRNPGPTGWGCACSHLIESLVVHPENFLKRIIGDYTYDSHEYRLNGAGLKMFWSIDRETRKFRCRIGGDQADMYPEFVKKASDFIYQNGAAR